MQKFSTAIIGAGASGIVAAISAKREGNNVVICERMPSIAKKILASGAGRCNLLNEKLDESFYKPSSRPLVKSVLDRVGKSEILDFFRDLGLHVYSDQGRIFPVTNQAASVLNVLEIELSRLAIPVALGFEVASIADSRKGFIVTSQDNRTIACDNLILAGGGKSYPALGSNGSCYAFAQQFGHRVIAPVPSAVPLEIKDKICHILQGQKINVCAKSVINGKIYSQTNGELLFTKYGLSGTAILDVSQEVSVALHRERCSDVAIVVDMVPFLDKATLAQELLQRLQKRMQPQELLAGILPTKFSLAFSDVIKTRDAATIAEGLKNKTFAVHGTRGWNEAEFTAGGVDTAQLKPGSLESQLRNGLYFCGEILDIEGKRGGYNLAWAFSSGFVAGLTE